MITANTAIILAGGKSLRMGQDKQELTFDGNRLIDVIIDQLHDDFNEIIIVTNKPHLYGGRLICTQDTPRFAGRGPLAGLHAGLTVSSSDYSFLLACDMPYVNKAYLRYMKEQLTSGQQLAIVTREGENIAPFHGFYSKENIPLIENFLGTGRASLQRYLQGIVPVHYVDEAVAQSFDPNLRMFVNLNTKEEWRVYKLSGW